jgi:hypothetical protein
VSGEVYAEYGEVIRRPRFKRSETEIADAIRAMREMGIWSSLPTKCKLYRSGPSARHFEGIS